VTGLRGSLWRLCAVLAALVLPVAMASAWLAAVVTDSDAYVDTVGPLASNETVQAAAADVLETAAISSVQGASGQSLDDARRQQVSAAVGAAVKSSEFEEVWRSANRTAHEQVITILEEDRTPQVAGKVVVELGPVVDSVARTLDERGLVDASQMPAVEASLPLVPVSDLERARSAYRLLDAAGFWVPALWVVLVALTLLIATERRRALIWLGVGSIVGLAMLALGLLVARGVLLDELGSDADDDVIRAIWDVLVSRLYWAAGIGFVVAVGTIVLAAVVPRRPQRDRSLVREPGR
jgi:hypothetical protein